MIRLSVNDTVVVDPGQDVVLTCEVTAGFPSPTVTWSRYPGPLPLSAQVRGPMLILRAVTAADAGFYNCTAVNNVGNPARKNINLVVRSKYSMCLFVSCTVVKRLNFLKKQGNNSFVIKKELQYICSRSTHTLLQLNEMLKAKIIPLNWKWNSSVLANLIHWLPWLYKCIHVWVCMWSSWSIITECWCESCQNRRVKYCFFL